MCIFPSRLFADLRGATWMRLYHRFMLPSRRNFVFPSHLKVPFLSCRHYNRCSFKKNVCFRGRMVVFPLPKKNAVLYPLKLNCVYLTVELTKPLTFAACFDKCCFYPVFRLPTFVCVFAVCNFLIPFLLQALSLSQKLKTLLICPSCIFQAVFTSHLSHDAIFFLTGHRIKGTNR